MVWIYIIVCIIWAFIISFENNNQHYLQALLLSVFVTPVFSKWAYCTLYDSEIKEIKRKKLDEISDKRKKEMIEKYDRALAIDKENEVIRNWSKKKFPESRIKKRV